MAVSYKPLFKKLIDLNMKKSDLGKATGLSSSTISKLVRGDNVTVEVIEKICTALNCTMNDILEFIPDNGPE